MPSEPVSAGPLSELPVGESKTIRFGRYPALILNTPGGLRAYSAVCTHFACIVKWDSSLGQIVCPCHEGYFAPEDGSVLAGPPPTPLESLQIEVIDGDITVGGTA
jgi:Rieske Fe-S protein